MPDPITELAKADAFGPGGLTSLDLYTKVDPAMVISSGTPGTWGVCLGSFYQKAWLPDYAAKLLVIVEEEDKFVFVGPDDYTISGGFLTLKEEGVRGYIHARL